MENAMEQKEMTSDQIKLLGSLFGMCMRFLGWSSLYRMAIWYLYIKHGVVVTNVIGFVDAKGFSGNQK